MGTAVSTAAEAGEYKISCLNNEEIKRNYSNSDIILMLISQSKVDLSNCTVILNDLKT